MTDAPMVTIMRRAVNLILFGSLLLAIVVSGVVLWLTYTQAVGLVQPVRSAYTQTPADFGITDWETVQFNSGDGTQLAGWFLPPGAKDASVILVHGLAANRITMLEQALLVNQQGYGALLFDLRNHGASAGDLTTIGYTEAQDVQAAFAYLQQRPDVNPDRIGLIGESMGGAAVLLATPDLPTAKVVVVESTFTSLEDNVADAIRDDFHLPAYPLTHLHLWFVSNLGRFPAHDLRPIDAIAQVSPRPLLIMHGAADSLLPVHNAERLYAAASEPKHLHIIPGAEHAGLMAQAPAEFTPVLLDFLEEYL